MIQHVKSAGKSTTEGIFELLFPKCKVYMQEVVDQHI